MDNPRRYGPAPRRVAIVHGGPGAAGSVAAVARELGRDRGVLEPLQTATTLDGQVEELAGQIEAAGAPPVVLVGHSWGAWLVLLLAADRPRLAQKLVLVGSGPFTTEWLPDLRENRRGRLRADERAEFDDLLERVESPDRPLGDRELARLGELVSRSDDHDPLPPDAGDAPIEPDAAIFSAVWSRAAALRESGELLERVSRVRAPVVALHGEEDPHPADGVEEPLGRVLSRFRMVRIPGCGHSPWRERRARDAFYRLLRREI